MSSPARSDIDSATRRAQRLQQQAVAANLTGHPAVGARLAIRGLETLRACPPGPGPASSHQQAYAIVRLTATLAKSTVETDGLERALTLMDRADETAGQLDDRDLQAFLLGQRGLILFRGGRLAEARRLLDAAAAGIPDHAGIDKWRVLVNRGALFVELGLVSAARRDLEHAAVLARDNGLPQAERIALHNLGCLEFTAGDLPKALRLMRDGMELDGDTQQGIAHLDRSRVLLAAGLPDEADAALTEAADLFRQDRCWQDLGEVDLTRAEVALLSDRVADARRLAARARDRFRRHGNDRWRRAAELVLLHTDHAIGRPPGRLLPPARRLAAEFAQAGFTQQARTAMLLVAELELESGHPGQADALLAQVGTVGGSDPIALRLHARLVQAQTLERRGAIREARRAVARGLGDLAAYQAQFGGIDLQSASAVHGRRLAAHDLDLALRSGRPESVLAAVERSRAVSGRIRPVTPPADQRAAELLTELRRIVDSAAAAPAGSRSTDADHREIARLQAELRSRSWLNSGSRAWKPPTTVRDLRAAGAEEGCHLVTVSEVRGRLGAVTITAGGPLRVVDLGDADTVRAGQLRLAADLDVLANAGLPPALVVAVTRSLGRTSAELGSILAAAVPADDRPVVISPNSARLALPWSLLPQLADRPFTATPSLSCWYRGRAALSDSRTGTSNWSLTAVAGPDLPRAGEEAALVARTWADRAAVVDLPRASPSDLLAAMSTSRVVHVAAHGVHRGQNPMFSSLSLTGGPLFAYELDQHGRVPEHVVLSACDAGRTTVRAGEETLGLTSVLLQLGTPSVVAGVARVHDEAAAEIMLGYHAELARGRSAAEALSQVGARVDTPNPFVCFGAAWRC